MAPRPWAWEARWAAISEAEASCVSSNDPSLCFLSVPSPVCFCMYATLAASLLTSAGSAREAISRGEFAVLPYGPTRGRFPAPSPAASAPSCAATASRPHCCNMSCRPTMSSENKVKPASPTGCSGGGGAGVAAARAAFNCGSDAAFSSWADCKASSAWRRFLHFWTLASAFRCFAMESFLMITTSLVKHLHRLVNGIHDMAHQPYFGARCPLLVPCSLPITVVGVCIVLPCHHKPLIC